MIYIDYVFAYLQIMVVVVKSGSVNICSPSSSFHYTTASHLYMRCYTASLRNSAEWRKKLFVKKSNECGSGAKVNSCQEEKGEKGEKERKNETLALNQKVTTNNENILSVFLDVHKVINTLSTHLEKIQVVERKEKMIDKKKGDIIYQTRDGRVLHAFHSCEQGKIIWEDIVYDDLKAWLAAASIEAPYRCYD